MSGPKLSKAEIERRRQQQLEKQREDYLHNMTMINIEKEKIKEWLCSDVFKRLLQENILSAQRLQKNIIQSLNNIAELPMPSMNTLSSYSTILENSIQECYQTIRQLQKIIEQEEKRNQLLTLTKVQNEEAINAARIIEQVQQNAPIERIIIGFDFNGDSQKLRMQIISLARQLQLQAVPDQKKLNYLVSNGCNCLINLAQDEKIHKKKDDVKRIIEKILNEVQEELRAIKETKELYQRYCILARVVGTSPRPFNSFVNTVELKTEIEVLDNRYRKKDEMDYIASQINEVMIQLGYSFVSSSVLHKNDGSEFDYSLYQAGKEAGISIYTDENGAVMMQMTNLGDGAVTAQDEEDSYQLQLNFCASHPDIVRELSQRGVFLKQVNYLPPAKKYAVKKKIVLQGTKKVVDRRKRRGNDKKVRYMQ